MSEQLKESTVGQLVARRPGRARVFEKFGIDYCCGGKKPVQQACRERGLDERQVLLELERVDEQPSPESDWMKAPLGELADHIEQVHHGYCKEELPRLEALARKVASVHGSTHPEVLEIHREFSQMKKELESHMLREERVLFPLCRELGQSPDRPCAPIENPISAMVHEHDETGASVERLRRLSGDYTPPPDACTSYRVLYDGLRNFEADLHQHVHKENNILFPRALEAAGRTRR